MYKITATPIAKGKKTRFELIEDGQIIDSRETTHKYTATYVVVDTLQAVESRAASLIRSASYSRELATKHRAELDSGLEACVAKGLHKYPVLGRDYFVKHYEA